jgi:Ca2+/Na+ antiporter
LEIHLDIPVLADRRRKTTSGHGWYAFFGRRKGDRYSSSMFFFLVSIVCLNVCDSLFTMMILDGGGWEANPLVQAVMDVHGSNFWIYKFAMVSVCLVLLCFHSKFRLVKKAIVLLTSFYLAVIIYQIYLLRLINP